MKRAPERGLLAIGVILGIASLLMLARRVDLRVLDLGARAALVVAEIGLAMLAMTVVEVWRSLVQRAGFSITTRRRAGFVALAVVGAVIGYLAWRGPAAQRLMPIPAFVALGAIGLLVAGWVLARARRAMPALMRGVFGGGALALLLVESHVFPGTYEWFHHVMILAALLLAALTPTIAATDLGNSPTPRAAWLISPLVICAASIVYLAQFPLARTVAASSALLGRVLPLLPLAERASAADDARLPRLSTPVLVQRAVPLLDGKSARIVVVTIDALRADRLTRSTMPHLSALANAGVVFDRAYTPTPHTSFALTSLHTGLDIGTRTTTAPLTWKVKTLAERFTAFGWKTAAFYPPAVFTIEPERVATMAQRDFGFEYIKREPLPSDRRLTQFNAWLQEVPANKSFAWLHFFEVHEPYEAHGALTHGTDASALYDGEVRWVDERLGELVAVLRKTATPTLLVVTADHGEELGDHGGRYHGTTLFEEQIRVPLVVVGIGLERALPAHHVREIVSLIDLFPTLLAAADAPPATDIDGVSILPLLVGESLTLGPTFANLGTQRATIEKQRKRIVDPVRKLEWIFDLADDPSEQRNLVAVHPEWSAELAAELAAWERRDKLSEGDRLVGATLSGDPAAVAELARKFTAVPRGRPQHMAARRIARFGVRDDIVEAAKHAHDDRVTARWLELGMRRVNGTPECVAWLDSECANGDAGVCATAALACHNLDALGRALLRLDDTDPDLSVVITMLARSHDPRALDPLLEKLAAVRTRAEIVAALDLLDDYRVIGPLSRWAPHEPYISARLAMVRLLARMAARDPSGAARNALATIARHETEAEIRAALPPAKTVVHAPR